MRVILARDENATRISETLFNIENETYQENRSTIQIYSSFAISVSEKNKLISKV